jgi:DNA-binding MarR family transcriptional regulator
MTGLLDRLEGDGLVERLAQPEDGRKISVRLTVKGCRVLDEMLPDYYRHIAKFMVNLTEKALTEALGLDSQDIYKLSRNAFQASFLNPKEKKKLLGELDEFMSCFNEHC